jgi:hypothetical protein
LRHHLYEVAVAANEANFDSSAMLVYRMVT